MCCVRVRLAGAMPPGKRREAWRERRVFYLTPQVLMNDMSRGACVVDSLRCLVVDEAHKATGNHAYCQVRAAPRTSRVQGRTEEFVLFTWLLFFTLQLFCKISD